MSFRKTLLALSFLPGLMLSGCSGDSGEKFSLGNGDGDFEAPPSGNTGNTGGSSGNTGSSSQISFVPLSVYERLSSYSGFDGDGLFQGEMQDPLIPVYLINPINTATLAASTSAVASDFKMTVDDVEIDPKESFPVLQKIVGNPVFLRTALLFDLTNSADEVDYEKLFAEAKNYITAAKASSNPIIANQEFVVWGFGDRNPAQPNIYEVTSGFTSDQTTIELALDNLKARVDAGANVGATSNLHKAIVQVVGRYKDDDADPPIDFSLDGDNELFDAVTSNGVVLSQLAVFSSGPDTLLEFDSAKMVNAIQSQGFLQFDPADPTASTQNFTNKAVFYFVVGNTTAGEEYETLSAEAERTRSLTLSGGNYTFANTLISDQIAAISKRINLNNQYIYRYAFLPRQGDHTAVLSSRSTDFNYSLTTQYSSEYFETGVWNEKPYKTLGSPSFELSSLVEITGPNGEYLAGDQASLSVVSRFRPATRWTSRTYSQATDYDWVLTSGEGTKNTDGSYTVTSITGDTATLEVTNTVRGESARITLSN